MSWMTMRFPGGLSKAVTLSYDDGVLEDTRLIDIMKRYGLRGTFNVNSAHYREEGYYKDGDKKTGRRMPMQDASALYGQDGIEVALHSLTHPFLNYLSRPQIAYEISKDRDNLEKQFGRVVRGMAYPNNSFNDDVIRVLEDCGIVYARTTDATHGFGLPTDWLRLDPTCHHNDPKLPELTQKFVTEAPKDYRQPWLFYLWGHAYEFSDNDNWEVIENFSKAVGDRNDIWYATNIEIYEYVEAFGRLVFTMDMERVKNPTSQDLWLMKRHTLYHVPAGATVSLHCPDWLT